MDIAVKFVRNAKIDCYFMTNYKQTSLKTKVVTQEEGGEPITFNQEIWIPLQIPLLSKQLIVKCMDEDTGRDETAGSLAFDIADLIDGKINEKFHWKNIYGSPKTPLTYKNNSAYEQEMNEHPDNASNWVGRVLMQVICEKTDDPIDKVVPITDDNILMEARTKTKDRRFDVIAEIGQAVSLPQDNKKYKIKLIIGGKELITGEPKTSKRNYHRYDHRFT